MLVTLSSLYVRIGDYALEFLKKKESSTPVVKTETPILSDKSYQGVYSEYAGQQIIKSLDKMFLVCA